MMNMLCRLSEVIQSCAGINAAEVNRKFIKAESELKRLVSQDKDGGLH
jgi:hypothetical protein